jgi:O-antigen/teichoic acid export membrane protein
VGAFVGLAGLGALRAGQIVLGPLQVLFVSIPLFAIPEGVTLRQEGGGLARAGVVLSGACVLVSAAYGAVVLLLPDRIGVALLGAQWEPARAVLPALTASWMALAAATGAIVGLRVLASARQSLRVRLLAVPFSVAAGLTGAWAGGAVGGAVGLAVATALSTVLWWRQFLVTAAGHGEAPLRRRHERRPPAAGDRGERWTADDPRPEAGPDGSCPGPSDDRRAPRHRPAVGGDAVAEPPPLGAGDGGEAHLRGAAAPVGGGG